MRQSQVINVIPCRVSETYGKKKQRIKLQNKMYAWVKAIIRYLYYTYHIPSPSPPPKFSPSYCLQIIQKKTIICGEDEDRDERTTGKKNIADVNNDMK